MKVCIYCKVALSPATRLAHVWPAALGGKLKSRKICCDDCNNSLSVAEKALHHSLRHAFASVGATNDEKEPMAVRIQFADRDFVMSNGNAEMETPGSRYDRESKSLVVPLPAGLDAQAEAMARAMRRQGLDPDDIEKLTLAPGDPEPDLPVGPTRSEHDFSVGGSVEHKRVFVKMALELLAFNRHDLAVRPELAKARLFVRHADGIFSAKVDARSAGAGLLPDVVPEVFNAIEAWTFGSSLFFRVAILGPLKFTGALTTTWKGEPFRAAYAFDARDPASVVTKTFLAGDGPNLSLWLEGMKEEASAFAASNLEAVSLRLAQSKSRVEREAPPDLSILREATRRWLAKLPPKKSKNPKS